MGSDVGYYYGWEVKCYLAVEGTYGTSSTTAGDYVQPAYIRAANWTVNDNVERIYGPGSSYRRGHGSQVKGKKDVTAHVEFWMADDFGATGEEPFLVKFALDKYNTTVATSTYAIPESAGTYPGDSAYGSYSLLPFTLEVGFNKSSDLRTRIISGCYVNSETVKAEMGEKCMWSWDIVAKELTLATAFVGTGTQATGAPLDWSGCRIKWTGEDDTATYHSGCEMLEWTTANTLEPIVDLTGTTQDREVSGYYTGKREITGTMRWKKATTAGQKWMEILFSATEGTASSAVDIQAGELKLEIASGTTGCSIVYTLKDIIIGEIPEDIDFEKVTILSIPFSSRYLTCDIVSVNTAAEMTNWDVQAS